MIVGLSNKATHKYFGSFAKYYDLVSTWGEYQDHLTLVDFLDKVFTRKKVKMVLEVGVGAGRLAVPLVKRGYRLTGADLNAEMLKLAEKKSQKEKVKLKLVHKNMLELDFKNKFDAVFLGGGVLFYLNKEADAAKAFDNFYKALRKGGVLFLDMVNWGFVAAHFSAEDVWEAKKSGVMVRMHNKRRSDSLAKTFTHKSYVYVKDRGKVKRCVDVHKLHMWTQEDLSRLAKGAGFCKVKFLTNKNGAPMRFNKLNHSRFWLYGVKE